MCLRVSKQIQVAVREGLAGFLVGDLLELCEVERDVALDGLKRVVVLLVQREELLSELLQGLRAGEEQVLLGHAGAGDHRIIMAE